MSGPEAKSSEITNPTLPEAKSSEITNSTSLTVSYQEDIFKKNKTKGGGFRMGNTCIPVADSF